MKQKIRQFFIKTGVYDYLKYSRVFHLYERFLKPEVKKEADREILFYRSFLQPCHLIFDIGGNDGHKTEAFLTLADKIVCCEPDAKNYRSLQIRFRNRRKRVFLIQAALAAKEGQLPMFVHYSGSAFNTLNPKFKQVTERDDLKRWNEKIQFRETTRVRTTTLDALIQEYGTPYFIKIDVEGFELEVLKGLSIPVPYLSLECLFPEFKTELNQSIALLQALDPDVLYNISTDEKLQFESFIPLNELYIFLNEFKNPHFELIVKMNATGALSSSVQQ